MSDSTGLESNVETTQPGGASVALKDLRRMDHRRSVRLLRTRGERIRGALLALLLLTLPFLLEADITPPAGIPWNTWKTVLSLSMIAALVVVSLNVVTGYGGQANVAHIGFMITGSIISAHFGETLGWPFEVVLILAWIAGAGFGFLIGIPALRIRGLYLFMATLGIHFVAMFIFREYQLAAWGVSGVIFSPPEILGGLEISGFFRWYWLLLIVVGASILLMTNLVRFHFGRALVAVRENDTAATILGVNVTRTKLISFALTAGFISVAGVLFSHYLGALTDEVWTLDLLIDFVVMLILGGFGSIIGGVLGALFFYSLPVWLGWLLGTGAFDQFQFIQANVDAISAGLYGVAVVAILILKPAGLAALWESVKGISWRVWKRIQKVSA